MKRQKKVILLGVVFVALCVVILIVRGINKKIEAINTTDE